MESGRKDRSTGEPSLRREETRGGRKVDKSSGQTWRERGDQLLPESNGKFASSFGNMAHFYKLFKKIWQVLKVWS